MIVSDIDKYRAYIIPYVYELLSEGPKEDADRICLAIHKQVKGKPSDKPASVLVACLEYGGDISIESIYTEPKSRRKGHASALIDELIRLALGTYKWDEGNTEEDVVLKTLFRLPPETEEIFKAFLTKNGFSDFLMLEDDGEFKTWSALAYLKFFRDEDVKRRS